MPLRRVPGASDSGDECPGTLLRRSSRSTSGREGPVLRPWQGECRLSAQHKAHHQERMQERLLLVRLEMLEQRVWRAIAFGFEEGMNEESLRHALQMRRFAYANRRALQKFLRAYQ